MQPITLMSRNKSLFNWVFVYLFLHLSFISSQAQLPLPQKVGFWENVNSFTINQTEDYIILSLTVLGKNQLYEARLQNGNWSELVALDIINKHHGDGYDIEGPSLNYNERYLYFHANFPDSKGGFDIYYSSKGPNGWESPKNIGEPINTAANEMYPSITPGEVRLLFSRSIPDEEIKKPKDTPQCQQILMSLKTPRLTWGEPFPIHEGVNRGCEHSPSMCNDGKSVFFSAVNLSLPKEGYNIFYTREIMDDNWLVPQRIDQAASEETNINPIFINGNVYFLRKWKARRMDFGSIYKVPVAENFFPQKTFSSKGKVVALSNGAPLDATLTVFDPTTLKILGVFYSDKETGDFEIPLLNGSNYIVDVRKTGYSFFSFMIDYRGEDKKHAPSKIELFDNIELLVAVYDSEIFRPLKSEVTVSNLLQSGVEFKGVEVEPGIYSFKLPMGTEYEVNAYTEWFSENSFQFNLKGDIVFSRFERNLPLDPKKRPFEINIADSETEEGVAAEILIRNLNRDETIFFSADDVKNGKITAMLREGDEYEFTIRGAQGYSFHNQVVDLGKGETRGIKADLVPLKAETAIRLNNINFGTSSADLSTESFPELDRVVQLIMDNPTLIIEISAHSDNVGSPYFNLRLSERRAQSVVNYLLDYNVPKERIVAKGYGLTKPMVPNTSDENRALNRRVEFKIIDILEEQPNEE